MVLRLALLLWSTAVASSGNTGSALDNQAIPPVAKGVAPEAGHGAAEGEETRSKADKPAPKPVAPAASAAGETEPADTTDAPKEQPAAPARGRDAAPRATDKASDKAAEKSAPADETRAAAERPAGESVEEGIWAWLERIDGEILPEKAREEIKTDAEAEVSERSAAARGGGVDIPVDLYDNPKETLAGDPLYLDQIDPNEFDIPIAINDAVVAKLRLFLGPHRKYIQKWLERKSRYEPMIRAELSKNGLPQDLIYLSMIESGFNPYAYSSAAAAGLWQFIPATGQSYGLDVDWWLDERRDPELATHAALKMLSDLHNMFGDWQLAFAAYNTGPGRIRSALAKAKKDEQGRADYWDLLRQDLLHPETEGYVPKIIAAAIIGHHPERYGFTNLRPEPPLEYDTVKVEGVCDVGVLAECTGLDEEAFRMLNPAIRRYATPDGTVDLRVPKGQAEAFTTALAKVPAEERMNVVQHKVARGETLSIIAGRYNVTSAEIIRVNGLRNPNQIEVGQYLVVPRRGSAGDVADAAQPIAVTTTHAAEPAERPSSSRSGGSSSYSTHRVRPGETLTNIADRYHVSPADLQRWNGIDNASHIEVGQTLKVRGDSAPSSRSNGSTADAEPAAAPAKALFSHTVVRGETVAILAERYHVGVSDLAKWNGIRDADSLEVGTVLKFYGGKQPSTKAASTKPTYYKIRSGDTLSSIADRHGVRMSDLQRWNGISNASNIRVGQSIKIYKGGGPAAPASSGATWITYTVRSGDSLGAIAERYGVSVSELRSWNRISGSTIRPGQKLKVKR